MGRCRDWLNPLDARLLDDVVSLIDIGRDQVGEIPWRRAFRRRTERGEAFACRRVSKNLSGRGIDSCDLDLYRTCRHHGSMSASDQSGHGSRHSHGETTSLKLTFTSTTRWECSTGGGRSCG
jgi:hypothetical protein